jgi:4-carboxymuconolactone decarboxylase
MSRFDDLPEARRRGLEKMEAVYDFEMTDGSGDFFRYTVEHLFGDVWQREGLCDRDRRLLLLGVLAATNQTDVLGIQVPAALANGELSPEQLREIVIFLCHYVGWPAGTRVNGVVEEAVAKHRR